MCIRDRGPLAAEDAVDEAVRDPAHGLGAELAARPLPGDALRLAVCQFVEGGGNLGCHVGGRGHPVHQGSPVEYDLHRLVAAGEGDGGRDRLGFQLADELVEGGRQVRVALVAGRLLRAGLEEAVEALPGAAPGRRRAGLGRREDAVDAHGAQSLGVQAHVGQRQVGAVGDAVEVPPVDAERLAQVLVVGGALDVVVGSEVDAGGGELVAAGLGGLDVQALGGRGVVDEADRTGVELVDVGAQEVRVGRVRAALGHEDDVAVAVQAAVDRHLRLPHRVVPGSAREPDDRVGLGCAGRRGHDGDAEFDRAAAGLLAVLGHGERAAAGPFERLDRFRCLRAGARLVRGVAHGAGGGAGRRSRGGVGGGGADLRPGGCREQAGDEERGRQAGR